MQDIIRYLEQLSTTELVFITQNGGCVAAMPNNPLPLPTPYETVQLKPCTWFGAHCGHVVTLHGGNGTPPVELIFKRLPEAWQVPDIYMQTSA